MKAKKLLKRVLEARGSKKASKKTRKRNRKFMEALYSFEPSTDEQTTSLSKQSYTVGADSVSSKQAILEYVRNVINTASTALDADLVNSKPVKSFEFGVFTFQFYDSTVPYRVLVSKDFDVNNIKTITATVEESVDKVDEAPEESK